MRETQVGILILIFIIEGVIFAISMVAMEKGKEAVILDLCINGAILFFTEILFFGYCVFSAFL